MNPEGIAGGKTAGIPNLLLIGGVVLVVYFLFFRNSQSGASGQDQTTGGGGTITTGDTTVGTGAVTLNVTQGSSSSQSGKPGSKPPGRRKPPKDINPGGPIRGKRRHKQMPKAGSPPRRHPVNEETRGAEPKTAIEKAQPQAPVHHRRKAMHFIHDGKP